ALVHPAAGATLPRPGAGRVAVAVAVALMGVALGAGAGRSVGIELKRRLPWALLVALVGVGLVHGWPSPSDQPVFAPQGLQLWRACVPAVAVAAALGVTGQQVRSQLAPELGLLAAALVLCRAPELWLAPTL